jgi:hypothetical protein
MLKQDAHQQWQTNVGAKTLVVETKYSVIFSAESISYNDVF